MLAAFISELTHTPDILSRVLHHACPFTVPFDICFLVLMKFFWSQKLGKMKGVGGRSIINLYQNETTNVVDLLAACFK